MPWLAFGMQTRELRDGEIVVGSASDAGWRVTTADLMPHHFALTVRGRDVSVRACTVDNVVAVNGKQVTGQPRALQEDDVISAGSGRFAYNLDAPRTAPLDPPAFPQAHLIDERRRVAHPLNSRSTPIGRDASNDVVLRDPSASRFHAEIRREAGGFALHSIGATGASVNGVASRSPRLLTEGDEIEIAFETFRFTQRPLPPDVGLAPMHSAENDEAGRRRTVSSEQLVVTEDNSAGRHSNRIKLIIAVVLGAILVLLIRERLGF
jgi:pSer/pThr/pTyr-binding forkhead associated (FHA) protein